MTKDVQQEWERFDESVQRNILIRAGAALQSIAIGDANGSAKYTRMAVTLACNQASELRSTWVTCERVDGKYVYTDVMMKVGK